MQKMRNLSINISDITHIKNNNSTIILLGIYYNSTGKIQQKAPSINHVHFVYECQYILLCYILILLSNYGYRERPHSCGQMMAGKLWLFQISNHLSKKQERKTKKAGLG